MKIYCNICNKYRKSKKKKKYYILYPENIKLLKYCNMKKYLLINYQLITN